MTPMRCWTPTPHRDNTWDNNSNVLPVGHPHYAVTPMGRPPTACRQWGTHTMPGHQWDTAYHQWDTHTMPGHPQDTQQRHVTSGVSRRATSSMGHPPATCHRWDTHAVSCHQGGHPPTTSPAGYPRSAMPPLGSPLAAGPAGAGAERSGAAPHPPPRSPTPRVTRRHSTSRQVA